MKSIRLTAHVGQDGMLNLAIPLDIREVALEVLVVVQPLNQEDSADEPRDVLGWPADFLETVAGSWKGEALVRSEQGAFESRDRLL